MIEVVTFDRAGRIDSADAPDPEAAIVAARTLRRDALDASSWQGYRVEVGFYVDGALVQLIDHAI